MAYAGDLKSPARKGMRVRPPPPAPRRTPRARPCRLFLRNLLPTLRHSSVTGFLEAGFDIRTVQELLGLRDVRTTIIYTHVLSRDDRSEVSPADGL